MGPAGALNLKGIHVPVGRFLESREGSPSSSQPTVASTKKTKPHKTKKKKGSAKDDGAREANQATESGGKGEGHESLAEAEELLRLAVRTNQGHGEAWYHLGAVLKIKGSRQEAQQAFARYSLLIT
jgi:Flp pilus assembly protein TadD